MPKDSKDHKDRDEDDEEEEEEEEFGDDDRNEGILVLSFVFFLEEVKFQAGVLSEDIYFHSFLLFIQVLTTKTTLTETAEMKMTMMMTMILKT
jgi:hypothetical protein